MVIDLESVADVTAKRLLERDVLSVYRVNLQNVTPGDSMLIWHWPSTRMR